KFVTDVETLQTIAELCATVPADEPAIAFEAIASVTPGGHFFSAQHTMARYRTAFYESVVADWSNFGTWHEAGGKTATERAQRVWKERLAQFQPPAAAPAIAAALDPFIERRKRAGGAAPES